MDETKETEKQNIFIFTLIFALLNLGIIAYLSAFPILDFINYYILPSGESIYNAYYFTWLVFSWWIVLFFIVGNALLAFILFCVLADPKNPSRTDVHSIISAIVLAINIVVFIALSLCFFFLVNTSFSGRSCFNDLNWCKEFALDHPELCSASDYDASYVCTDNVNFIIIWIISGIEVIFAFIHLAVNRLVRVSGVVDAPNSNPREGKIMGLVFSFLYIFTFAWYVAFPLLDTIFINGYPLMAIPPSPGPFYTTQYQWQWWFLWLYGGNLFPPIFFILGLIFERNRLISTLHFWGSLIVGFVTLAPFVLFLVVWFSNCNSAWSEGSICNDYEGCQVFFGNWVNVCDNVVGSSISLGSNAQFNQILLFGLLFIMLVTVQIWVNYRMRRYGVFK
jgi:hypothetical protein